jgi:TRAP-type C4-dicarboxylate transport system permease small subunit
MRASLERLNQAAVVIAGYAVLIMALSGGLDVLGAVVLGRPIPGVYEGTELLMPVVIVLAMARLQSKRMNLYIDMLPSRLSTGSQKAVVVLGDLLGLALLGLIAWQAWLLAWDSVRQLEYAQGGVQIPAYPSKIAFAVGMSLLVAQYIADLAGAIRNRVAVKTGSNQLPL